MATKGAAHRLGLRENLQPRRLLQCPDFGHQRTKVKRGSGKSTRSQTLTFGVEQQQLGIVDTTQFGAEINGNRPANRLIRPFGNQGTLGQQHQYGRGPKNHIRILRVPIACTSHANRLDPNRGGYGNSP